jgi:hypothetical protein
LGDVVKEAEVVVIGTRGVGVDKLRSSLRPEHIVIDLVNLDRKSRPANSGDYEGICW